MLTVIHTIAGYLKRYKLLTFFFLLFFGLDLLFISIAPLSFNFIIDYAVEPKDMTMFVKIIVILATLGIVCTIAGVVGDYLLSKLNALVESDLRNQLFARLQKLHMHYFYSNRTGDTVALFSNDLPTISSAMTSLMSNGIQSVVIVVVSMGVLFYLEWSMAVLIIIGASLIFIGPLLLSRRADLKYAQYKQQIAILNSEVQENVKAQKLIKSFNLHHYMQERFGARVKQLFISSYQLNVMNASLGRIPMISLLIVNLAIMGFGSYLALTDKITIGALVAFYTMYISMGNSVYSLTFIIPTLTDAKVSIGRIQKVMDEEQLESALAARQEPLQSPLHISVNDVTFGYSEEQTVLEHNSISIPFGSSVAFVGSSGSGKSSIVQLILGLYQPRSGSVYINDKVLDGSIVQAYRNQVAIVLQDNFLFQGTILENIQMSQSNASFEQVVQAAKLAEIHDYIISLPQGYNTEVLDEGSNFSGGQRQRLAIARALVRDPKILILDEATSALDPATEHAINATFSKLAQDRTIITVTHRLSTITNVDQIYVFDHGKIVEHGSHQELLASQRQYSHLWEKQQGFSYSDEGEDVTIDAARLSRLAFFQNVSDQLLESIASLFNTERFDTGTTIIHEGDKGEKFYLIIRGRVEVLKQTKSEAGEQVRVAVLEDGDHFGEIALLESVPRTASIRALTPCIVITLQRKVLHHILSQHPEINQYVRKVLQERIS